MNFDSWVRVGLWLRKITNSTYSVISFFVSNEFSPESSYTHCCRALTVASARLSCSINNSFIF